MESVQQPRAVEEQAALLKELSDPDIQASLVELIRKLPRITEAVSAAERGIELVSAVANDRASLSALSERVDQVMERVPLNEETLESLITLLEKLPKLVKMVTMLEQCLDTVEAIVSDKQSMSHLMEGMKDIAAPITQPARDGLAVWQEAKNRASRMNQHISIFGVMKMLGDPTVQNGLRFTQALLEVIAERNTAKTQR